MSLSMSAATTSTRCSTTGKSLTVLSKGCRRVSALLGSTLAPLPGFEPGTSPYERGALVHLSYRGTGTEPEGPESGCHR